MKVNRLIFREYDIRGVVGTDIDETFAYHLGRAFARKATEHGAKTIAVGYDCRLTSPMLKDALIQGLNHSGLDVIDIGVVPTPLLYYALFNLPVEGGVQITASHNPPEFNGFKLCIGKETLYGEGIQTIRAIMEKEDYPDGKGEARGDRELIDRYIDEVRRTIQMGDRPLKVVVDAGNGTAGPVAPRLYRALGCEVVELYTDMDGTFPNHHPDPVVLENLKDLQQKVLETGADLGIGFDGDADRIGVIDESGRVIWGDQLLMIYARDLLARIPGAKIIFEVKCTMLLEEDIRKRGGVPIMWKAGHSLIKAKMLEEGALLAGEMSGHMFFKERFYGYDDAIYAGARLLEILSKTNEPLSALLKDLPTTYSTPEIRVACDDTVKFQVVERVVDAFKTRGHRVITVDGARVVYEDGWGLLRASNTQPALVLRFEALSEEALKRIQRDFEMELRRILSELGLPDQLESAGH